jgi:hypothetical protein
MADKPKMVRLRNTETGVVVETTEENAARIRGYEPVKASSSAKDSTASKSSK